MRKQNTLTSVLERVLLPWKWPSVALSLVVLCLFCRHIRLSPYVETVAVRLSEDLGSWLCSAAALVV